MNYNFIAEILLFIFTTGITYGSFNNRLKQTEKRLDEHKDNNERLARMEEKINFLIETIKK